MKLVMALPPPELDEELPEPEPAVSVVGTGPRVRTGHFGDFDLLGEIGRGGMGVIYRAVERSLKRDVALKLIRDGSLARQADIDRFLTEAAAAAQLVHPHIVKVHGVGKAEGQHYYSMEFVTGRSLAEKLRTGPLDSRLAAQILEKVAQAIELAHKKGILHRDLKPANILMDEKGEPKVADFGLAKNLQSQSEHSLEGAVVGSPHYMPPEQARGQQVSFQSDVYSLGAVLYDMLTGRPPFSGATAVATMRLVEDQEPVPPRALNPAVPLDLETICLKCLAKDPKGRYSTAEELAQELRRYLGGIPIQARPVSALERAWRWCKRKPTLASLAAVVAIAPMVVIGVMYVYGQRIAAESRRLAAQTYGADVALADRALADRDYGAANWALLSYAPAARAGINFPGAPGFEWRWLWQKAQGEALRTIPAHQGKVTSVTFSIDGHYVVSGSDDGSAILWNGTNGSLVRTFVPPPRPAFAPSRPVGTEAAPEPQAGISPSFTADGENLLIGDAGGLALWSLRDWQCRLNFGSNHINSPVCSPTDPELAVATVTEQSSPWHSLVFFDLTQGHFSNSFSGMDVQSFCFAPDGEKLAYWDYLQTNFITLQPLRGGKVREVITNVNPSEAVLDMVFTPDGKILAVGRTLPGGVDLYDVSNRKFIVTLPMEGGRLGALAISADGQWLATGGADQAICLWDLSTRKKVRQFWGHAGTVSALTFSPDGQQLVSGGWDGTVRFWDVAPAAPLQSVTNVVGYFTFSPDGQQLLTQGTNGMARLWELPGHANFKEWAMPAFQSAVFRSDGKVLMAGISGPKHQPCMWFYDIAAKRLEDPLAIPDTIGWNCTAVTLSPDGEYLAAGYQSGVVALWQVRDQKLVQKSLPGLGGGKTGSAIKGLLFSVNQRRLVAFSRGGSSLITASWELPSWDRSGPRSFSGTEIKFALSPNGEYFALSGKDQPLGIKSWKRSVNEDGIHLQGNVGIASALAFSADGRTLASGEAEGLIKLWHLESRRAVANLGASKSKVTMSQLVFSGDGSWLGMSDSAGELHLFHAPAPSPVVGSAVP